MKTRPRPDGKDRGLTTYDRSTAPIRSPSSPTGTVDGADLGRFVCRLEGVNQVTVNGDGVYIWTEAGSLEDRMGWNIAQSRPIRRAAAADVVRDLRTRAVAPRYTCRLAAARRESGWSRWSRRWDATICPAVRRTTACSLERSNCGFAAKRSPSAYALTSPLPPAR
jgi:hypothetical protein